MYWGGKQRLLRDSTVLAGTLGNYNVPAKMYYIPKKGTGDWKNGPKWVTKPGRHTKEMDMSLKEGQTVSAVFGPNDPPPWYDLDAPRYARPRTAKEIEKETCRRNKAREKLLEKKQLKDPLATLSPQEQEQFQTSDTRHVWRVGKWLIS